MRNLILAVIAILHSGCAQNIYGGKYARRVSSSPEYINVQKIQSDFSTGNSLLTALNTLTPIGFLAPLFGLPRITFMGTLDLTVTPQDAMSGIGREALTFVAPQDQSVTVTLDFNAKLREQLKQSGQGTRYFPDKVIITIVCKRTICRASADPDIISSTGAITLQTRHLVYEKRMLEIKAEEQVRNEEEAMETASRRLRRDTEAASQYKNCPGLLKLMASADAIMAQYGAEKTVQVLDAATEKFQEYRCSEWVGKHPSEAAIYAR